MKKYVLLLVLIGVSLSTVFAQQKSYTSNKVEKSTIKIDGIIDEADWNNVIWENNFTQYEPNEGDAPTQNTEFKILYDDNYLYIAIKAFDTEPEKIEKRMSRRDSWDGDLVAIQIDSYFDKKTAFVFAVSASGVRSDARHDCSDRAEDRLSRPVVGSMVPRFLPVTGSTSHADAVLNILTRSRSRDAPVRRVAQPKKSTIAMKQMTTCSPPYQPNTAWPRAICTHYRS